MEPGETDKDRNTTAILGGKNDEKITCFHPCSSNDRYRARGLRRFRVHLFGGAGFFCRTGLFGSPGGLFGSG